MENREPESKTGITRVDRNRNGKSIGSCTVDCATCSHELHPCALKDRNRYTF